MKFIWSILILSFSFTTLLGQGIDFFHGTWEEALEKAQAEEKIIFVDAYTTWCGPCKRMAKNVFTKEEVGDFFNANFVNMKIDMEKKDGIKFGHKYPVAAYPTLFFIDGKGKVVQKVKGAQNVDGFLGLGKSILAKADFSAEYAEAYEAGDRSPELIHKYVKALNKAGKSSGRIVNDYLKTQNDLSTAFNLQFLHDAVVAADSKAFEAYVAQKKNVITLVSASAFQEKVKKACEATLNKAIEFQSRDLMEESKKLMKTHGSEQSEKFAIAADMSYALSAKDAKTFSKAIKIFQKKYVGKNAAKLYNLSVQCQKGFPTDVKLQEEAMKLAAEACQYGGLPEYHLHLAQLLMEQKQNDKALVEAKKALELSKGNREKESLALKLIRRIENA